jgi:superfamily I DNA/RNA helicase
MSLWDAMNRHSSLEKISDEQHRKIDSFIAFYQNFNEQFTNSSLSLTIRNLLQDTGYLEHLKRAYKEGDDYIRRLENIEELIHGIEIYENKFRKKKPTLAGYLQEIALIASESDDEPENKPSKGVALMTLHKSKGLEFPVVFLAALDSTYIPSPVHWRRVK